MNEALVNLLQEMRYARQSAWNVLEFCPPALTPANSCERLAKGECRVRQPLSILERFRVRPMDLRSCADRILMRQTACAWRFLPAMIGGGIWEGAPCPA